MRKIKVGRPRSLSASSTLTTDLVPVKQKKWTDQDMSSALDAVQHGDIMNHDSGFIIGIAQVFFAKTLIECTAKNHLINHPSI